MTNVNPTEDGEVQFHNQDLIVALFDGFIESFEYQGIRVRREGDSIKVETKGGYPLGGRVHIPSSSVEFAENWLQHKARLYGELQ